MKALHCFFISLLYLLSVHCATIDQNSTQNATSVINNPNGDPTFNTKMGFILVGAGAIVPALGGCLLYVEDLIRLFPRVQPDFTITKSPLFMSSILSFSVGVLLCSIFIALLPEAIESFETSRWLEGLGNPRTKKIVGSSIFAFLVLALIVKRVYFKSSGHGHSNPEKSSDSYGKDLGDGEITYTDEDNNTDSFKKMGNRIAIAFFLHNIPEGLVTFLSIYDSYKTGIMFTVALSLHKLPEGIMVAIPIYYGYRSKWKAVAACLICTWIPQMLGALIGWASTKLIYDSLITGVMFLIATTILSQTTFNEVIPMAQSYDPTDKYTTNWILVGIVLFMFMRSALE